MIEIEKLTPFDLIMATQPSNFVQCFVYIQYKNEVA